MNEKIKKELMDTSFIQLHSMMKLNLFNLAILHNIKYKLSDIFSVTYISSAEKFLKT